MHIHIRGCHPLWPAFPDRSINTFLILRLTRPCLSRGGQARLLPETLPDYCGPATPDFPCESSGLGCSEFARHYYRNHGCFLFLGVLRWFTSPRSLPTTMNSSQDSRCSHRLGSPIRKSPDHGLLASPRGLSQLATSFIAYLRQGIHTHALSSLTIKFTLNTEYSQRLEAADALPATVYWLHGGLFATLQLPVNIQLSKIRQGRHMCRPYENRLVGLGRIELPTSPLSGVRSSQLSYRPSPLLETRTTLKNRCALPAQLVELVGIEPATS